MARKRKSTQELMGIETFSKYGLKANKSELAFFIVQPTNISVLSEVNIEMKIHNLMQLLSMVPELEIICLDSCECFDANKQNILNRLNIETNENIRKLLKADLEFLDNIQVEMSTARQFMFCIRFKKEKNDQIFNRINRVSKAISQYGFEAKSMTKADIKRMLAIYFGSTMHGDLIEDTEGYEKLEDIAKELEAQNYV